jgi:uncharacterized protein (TIGR03067 family)
MLRLGIVVLLSAGAALAAPVPKALKKAPALDGRWEAVALRASGNAFTRTDPWVWDIDGETVTRHAKQKDGSLLADGPATLTRPDARQPDEVDYLLPSGQQSTLFRARIEVSGDELVINFANVNATRPPDMTELKDGYHYRFKRVEKK